VRRVVGAPPPHSALDLHGSDPGALCLTAVMAITLYGVVALTFMMTMYAVERRHRLFVLDSRLVASCPVSTASFQEHGPSASSS
jgi:hypothetical protein